MYQKFCIIFVFEKRSSPLVGSEVHSEDLELKIDPSDDEI